MMSIADFAVRRKSISESFDGLRTTGNLFRMIEINRQWFSDRLGIGDGQIHGADVFDLGGEFLTGVQLALKGR